MTIADELITLNNTKIDIKDAIEAKGVTVGAVPFSDYAAKINLIETGGTPAPGAWVRPADWLTLPTVTSTEEKFVGLFAVYDNESNFVAFSAAGNYTVDWGDGTVQNFNSGIKAEYNYNYSTIGSGTLSSRGYRQVIVTITPQAGQTFSALNLQRFHTSFGGNSRYMGWLDIAVSMPNATAEEALNICWSLDPSVFLDDLEQVTIIKYNSSVLRNLFRNATSLKSVSIMNTATGITDVSAMFQNCHNLDTIPEFDTSTATNMSSMFQNCRSLTTVPLLDTANVTNMAAMFVGCNSLTTVPLFNTADVTTMTYMFYGCHSLITIPLFDTTAVNDTSGMFGDCFNLTTVPLMNTAAVTNMESMFLNCRNLSLVPQFNTGLVTNMANMFQNCRSLVEVNLTSTALLTGSSSTNLMFDSCLSLRRIRITTGFIQTFQIYATNLGPTALNELYTSLGTVSGKTITVTGNWGTASDDPTIATAKGWTVTG